MKKPVQLFRASPAKVHKTKIISAKESVRELSAYSRSDFSVRPGTVLRQLSQNESPFDIPSSWVLCALGSSNAEYPDPECTAVRELLATKHDLDPAGIVCTAGLMEAINSIFAAYVSLNDEIVLPNNSFAYFAKCASLHGAVCKIVELEDLHTSCEGIARAVRPSTRAVFIANPANPIGTYIISDKILELRRQLPDETLLVIDEAYVGFVDPEEYEDLFELSENTNTIVLRSLSKSHGLAGFRSGWLYTRPEIAATIKKVQIPSIVSAPAQKISLKALSDEEVVRNWASTIRGRRATFTSGLKHLPIQIPPSQTNFVLLLFEDARTASELDGFLRYNGVVTRPQISNGLPNALRVTIGTDADMNFVSEQIINYFDNGFPKI